MSDGLRVLHVCDHVVRETKIEKKTYTQVKGEEGTNDKITDKEIESVDYILFDNSFLFEGYHFKVNSQDITWLRTDEIVPQPGMTYDIYFSERAVTNKGYSEFNCPKCEGRGWYVDTITPDNEAVFKAKGVDKLVQDFIKTLLTNSKYYEFGTSLSSLIGKVYDKEDIPTKIKMAVREAEETVKRSQYELSLEDTELTDDEILRVVNIDELYVNEEGDGYYMKLTLYTRKNLSVSIGLNL